jgi:hypothetical protein
MRKKVKISLRGSALHEKEIKLKCIPTKGLKAILEVNQKTTLRGSALHVL